MLLKNTTLLFVLLLPFYGFSQTDKYKKDIYIITMQDRYEYDYKLKDYNFIDGDSTILDLINIDLYEPQRHLTENVEIFLPVINQTLILFPMNNPRKGF